VGRLGADAAWVKGAQLIGGWCAGGGSMWSFVIFCLPGLLLLLAGLRVCVCVCVCVRGCALQVPSELASEHSLKFSSELAFDFVVVCA
jgi:hypothetical protein